MLLYNIECTKKKIIASPKSQLIFLPLSKKETFATYKSVQAISAPSNHSQVQRRRENVNKQAKTNKQKLLSRKAIRKAKRAL